MNFLRSVGMAFSCFSAVPMPQMEWGERNMRYMLAAFPLVGVLIGALEWLWVLGAAALGVGPILRGAVMALLPLAVTGGIHMDGFSDVVDAQASHASPQRKRQILKDPHVGAFAVMGVASYLLLSFALACEVDVRLVPAVAAIPVASRCLCGIATLTWPASGGGGMLAALRKASDVRVCCVALVVQLALAAGFIVITNALVGLIALACVLFVFLWVRRFSDVQFGGMSGDISGFLLQVLEIVALAAIVVAGKLVLA